MASLYCFNTGLKEKNCWTALIVAEVEDENKNIQEEQSAGVKHESSIYKKIEKKLESSKYNLKLEN